MINWNFLYKNLPTHAKRYIKKTVGNLNDFTLTDENERSNFRIYTSLSSEIEVSFTCEDDGTILAIWFPNEEDPSYTEHQIFIRNPFFVGVPTNY